MPNKKSAEEWLEKSYHDLKGALILYEANHYTDTIGYITQQSLEKMLKSILACDNRKINKSHNLIELYESVADTLKLGEEEIKLLAVATTYNTKVRYPTPHKALPKRSEVKTILDFAEELFGRICGALRIGISVTDS